MTMEAFIINEQLLVKFGFVRILINWPLCDKTISPFVVISPVVVSPFSFILNTQNFSKHYLMTSTTTSFKQLQTFTPGIGDMQIISKLSSILSK